MSDANNQLKTDSNTNPLGNLEKAAIRKLKRLGIQLVGEFGNNSDLLALAYQNCTRFPRKFWLSVSDIPTNDSGMESISKVMVSSETNRWLIYKSDGRWRDLIKEFDSCIEGMPATYFVRLGFDRLPENWLDFLVEYGLLEQGMFRLKRFSHPLHPICIHKTCFLWKGEIGNLAEFGVKSMDEITSLDSGWWTEEFDPIKMTIQTLEEILDCELFDAKEESDSGETEAQIAIGQTKAKSASLETETPATTELQRDALREVIDGGMGAVLNQASKVPAKDKYSAQMMRMFQNDSSYYEWSLREWAENLTASVKTISQTDAWKHRMARREENRRNT